MTQQEISKERRNEIKEAVANVVARYYPNPHLPVDVKGIIHNIPNIKLYAYSYVIAKNNITYEEMVLDANTKDSYIVYSFSKDRYAIYINDIDKNIMNSYRYRWNMAHELGHAILKHHLIVNNDKLRRYYVDDETYKYLELEADYFAQLLLVPHPALFPFKIKDDNSIYRICQVSFPAAYRRFKDYNEWKNRLKQTSQPSAYDQKIYNLYSTFINKKRCKICNSVFIQKHGKYCQICGTKNTLEWSKDEMKYDKLLTYSNGKLLLCPVCENEETDLNGIYCQICGTSLVNRCMNSKCDSNEVNLPSNARYCPICGEKTTFIHNKVILPVEVPTFMDEILPFE